MTRRRRLLVAAAALILLVAIAAGAFAEYQGSRRGLRARAGTLAAAEVRAAGEDAVSTYAEITLRGSGGRVALGRARVPRAGTAPYPAALLMGGINRGRRVVNVPGLETIARFAIVLSLDYPMKQRRSAWEGRQFIATITQLRTVGLDTVADILLALDYLASRPDVDQRRIFLLGSSLGAPAVTIAGAVDTRPAAVVSLYGAGRLGSLVAHTLQHPDQRRPYPRWQAVILGHALAWFLTPLEPVRYVDDIAPRPFLMVNGADDRLIPRANVLALFEAAGEPKDIIWMDGEHVQPDENALIAEVAGRIVEWLAQRGLLPYDKSL